MNPDYEKQLESRIDAELKQLGELRAPASLAPRVMRAIERQANRPWYRRSWQAWPIALRTASLAGLIVLFTALCLAALELRNGWVGQGSGELLGRCFAGVGALWKMLAVLANAASLVITKLGMGVILAGIALFFTAWIAFIGLGTVYVRLAMRPAINRIEL